MKSTTKIKKYLIDPLQNNCKLVGVSSEVDYSFQTKINFQAKVYIDPISTNLIVLHIGAYVPEDSKEFYGSLADSLNLLGVGIDETPDSEYAKYEHKLDYSSLNLYDMLSAQASHRLPYCQLALNIDDLNDYLKIDDETIKVKNSVFHKVSVKYQLQNATTLEGTHKSVGDLEINFLLLETKSELSSVFTEVINQQLNKKDTQKLLMVANTASVSLTSAILVTQEGSASSNLYPADSTFGISYDSSRNELLIGSLSGALYVPQDSIKYSQVTLKNGSYVFEIHIKYGIIKLLMMRN